MEDAGAVAGAVALRLVSPWFAEPRPCSSQDVPENRSLHTGDPHSYHWGTNAFSITIGL
jgi:hypothetical protein